MAERLIEGIVRLLVPDPAQRDALYAAVENKGEGQRRGLKCVYCGRVKKAHRLDCVWIATGGRTGPYEPARIPEPFTG